MKLNQTHFKKFKKYCEFYVEKFKLDNWEIAFDWIEDNKEGRAKVIPNISGYIATLYLSDEWYGYDKICDNDIKNVAKHEVIHIILARLSENGNTRFLSIDDFKESEEELVRKLEKLL